MSALPVSNWSPIFASPSAQPMRSFSSLYLRRHLLTPLYSARDNAGVCQCLLPYLADSTSPLHCSLQASVRARSRRATINRRDFGAHRQPSEDGVTCNDPQQIVCQVAGHRDVHVCADPLTDLENCGGCSASGVGRDCLSCVFVSLCRTKSSNRRTAFLTHSASAAPPVAARSSLAALATYWTTLLKPAFGPHFEFRLSLFYSRFFYTRWSRIALASLSDSPHLIFFALPCICLIPSCTVLPLFSPIGESREQARAEVKTSCVLPAHLYSITPLLRPSVLACTHACD